MCVILCNIAVIISIHALLAESDLLGRDDDMTQLEFLSTLSLRRATMGYPVSGQHYSISIHALLAESDRLSMSAAPLARRISIHALLAESDPRKAVTTRGNHRYFYPRSPCGERPVVDVRRATGTADFYPRSPCGERPPKGSDNTGKSQVFLSTLSLRRATIEEVSKYVVKDYFYPRSPCGERRWSMSAAPPARPISIHALLAESDSIDNSEISDNLTFLSTLSLRRATGDRFAVVDVLPISIHALLAESDCSDR